MSCGDLAHHLLGGRAPVLQLFVSRVLRCGSRTGSPLPFRRLSPRGWPWTILPPAPAVWASTLTGGRSSSSASAGPLATHELSASPRTFLRGVAGCARGSDQRRRGARRLLTSKTVYAFEHLAQNLVGPMSRWRPGRGRIQANKVRPSNPAAPVGRLRHSQRWWSSKDGGLVAAAVAFRGRR